MNSTWQRVMTVLAAWGGVFSGWSATVTWDGGGGDSSWQNRFNWSGDALPGSNDDVVINVVGPVTIVSSASVTIGSLQCSNQLMLSAGTFRVTTGDSVVQGQFTVTGTPVLSASGAATKFTLAGPVSANGAGLEATGGATLALPNLGAYSKGTSCLPVSWKATGTGSILDLPGLTNLTGGSCGGLDVQALNGGTVRLPNLATVVDGSLAFLADGTNSLVDLPVLQESLASNLGVSFEARNGGSVWMPQLPGGTTVSVTVKSGSVLPVSQLRQLSGFTVSATTVDFSSLTNLASGQVSVSGGAVVTAPNLAGHNHPNRCRVLAWTVSGAGSVLDLSSLTQLAGPGCGNLTLQATAGGTLILSNLPSVSDGTLMFIADGSGSRVDLGALRQSLATDLTVSFEARNGGTLWMPQLPGGPTVTVALKSGGALPVGQLEQLRGLTVSGMTVDFPSLTHFTPGNVTVSGGAVVTMPRLASHILPSGCWVTTWEVTGAGSVLDLSPLTQLAGPNCGSLTLEASAGGTLITSNLPSIKDGALYFVADGAGSRVDLGSVRESQATNSTVSFEARNGGTVWMPQLPGGPTVIVKLKSGGVLPVTQLEQLRGLTVSGMMADFSSLTHLTPGNVLVDGGAVVTLPSLVSHSPPAGCWVNTWEVHGAGSVLDLSSLSHLIGTTCGSLSLVAKAGGTLKLDNLPSLTEGFLAFLADGTNSLIDLSALQQSLATLRSVSLEARNDGTLWTPLMQGGSTVTVTIKSGGTLSVAQMDSLSGLTVSGTTLDLTEITNFFAGNLTVTDGAILRMSNLFKHDQGAWCNVNTWEVSGARSVLDLSSMTNLTGSSCGDLAIQALSGGTVNLSNLTTLIEGRLSFVADGSNSLVNLGALRESLGTIRTISLDARNRGTIWTPLLAGGPTVNVTIRSNGVLPVAQLGRLAGITASGATLNFSGLTNFDGGSLLLSNAATVTAPSLLTYAQGNSCLLDSWVVRDTGSVLDLSSLAWLTGAACGSLDIQALNGGRLLLGNMTNIPSGSVAVLASGSGSLIDLHSLLNFLNPLGQSSLVATNGGTILFNNAPFILSGVSLNLSAGTGALSPTALGGTNLLLHGTPWHSYWVESRDALSPANPWAFYQRVPMTNAFQVIGPRAEANQEFKVWEFTADPFGLELKPEHGVGVHVVLYGPTNQTFEVLATMSLLPPVVWEPFATVTMTNTFRILPTEPLTTPQRFFQVNPQ